MIAGPFTITLPSTQLFSFATNFNVPPPIAGSYLLRVQLSAPNSLTSLSVKLNNTQLLALSDFAGGVTTANKVATLLASNSIAVQVAGTKGTKITVTVFTLVLPKPVSLTPSPLSLNVGVGGTLTATLSPAPTAAGTLNVTSSNAGAATVPASVAFSSGQTSVAIPVSAVGPGTSTITASANGVQATATVNVNAPPTVSITAPAPGAVFNAPANVTVNATAADSDGTVAKVDFFDGTTGVGTATASPYSVTLANLASGTHTLTARATDNRGAATTSAAVSIIVNTPPTVSITTPAANAVFTAPASITITAAASDTDGTVAKVDFYQGTTLIGTATGAPFTFNWTNVAAGTYSLTAVATDNRGAATTSAAVSVTVNSGVAQLFFIHTDQLNTPRVITNQAAQVVWRWDNQDPFGANVPDENPSGLGTFTCNLRLPGQYFDKETNTHYNYFRDYDPNTGRYVQSDLIGLRGGINTYTYVYDNPLSFRDPSGQILPQLGVIFIVGGVTGLVQGTAAAIITATSGGGVGATAVSFAGGLGSGALLGGTVAAVVLTGGAVTGLAIEGLTLRTLAEVAIHDVSFARTLGGIAGGLGFDIGVNSIDVAKVISNANGAELPSAPRPPEPSICQ